MSFRRPHRREGLHGVGYVDLAFDSDANSRVATAELDQRCPDPTKHVVARLFYPTSSKESLSSPVSLQSSPYLPHGNYPFGLACYATGPKPSWWMQIVRRVMAAVMFLCMSTERLQAEAAAVPTEEVQSMPIMVFSHGVAGNRVIYSRFICRLVAQGCTVLALEHTDGLGSAARMAQGRGWLYFTGWGSPAYLQACLEHRVAEVRTAVDLMRKVQTLGSDVSHLHLPTFAAGASQERAAAALDLLKGRLDLNALMLAGHSYGGATMAAAVAQGESAASCLMYDPWYPPIPDAAITALESRSCPVLVLGSERFNTKSGPEGHMFCEGSHVGLQDRVLGACASDEHATMLVVPSKSNHYLVDDIGAIFSDKYGWLFKFFGVGGALEKRKPNAGAELGVRCTESTLAFMLQNVPMAASIKEGLRDRLSRVSEGSDGHSQTLNGAHMSIKLPEMLKPQADIFAERDGKHSGKVYTKSSGKVSISDHRW